MTKYEKFLSFVDNLIEKTNSTMDDDVLEIYNYLKNCTNTEVKKIEITDNGKKILSVLQEYGSPLTSKSIAEIVGMTSRCVSGAIRKLVSDGFVEKISVESPAAYTVSEKGKNVKIEFDEGENVNER